MCYNSVGRPNIFGHFDTMLINWRVLLTTGNLTLGADLGFPCHLPESLIPSPTLIIASFTLFIGGLGLFSLRNGLYLISLDIQLSNKKEYQLPNEDLPADVKGDGTVTVE